MRRAEPHELTSHAVPVITARLSEAELLKWFPIRFDPITDPLQAPEPSLAALVQLDAGGYVVLNYGKDSGQLIVELPVTIRNTSSLIAEFFQEVQLPLSRVLWHRAGTRLPRRDRTNASKGSERKRELATGSSGERAKRSALRVQVPSKRK